MDGIETQSQSHCSEVRSSPSASSIPATRPRSPDSNEAHCGFTKGRNTGDYKDPSHPGYLTQQWRYISINEKPLPHAISNQVKHPSDPPPMDMSPQSDVQSPQLEDIPEEDIPAREEVLKPEEGLPLEEVPVPRSFALDGPQSLFRILLDGCQDYL